MKSDVKPIAHLNALFSDYETALDAAATAQKDIVVILRMHFDGDGASPPVEMQAAANDLWYEAAQKKAELETFYSKHVERLIV